MKRSLTLSEKIIARASGKKSLKPGDVITASVDLATAHDACGKVLVPWNELGIEKVWDKDKIVISFDHWVPASSEGSAELHRKTREFVKNQHIIKFYDIGRGGICHQVVAEEHLVKPGMLVVGTDSHTTTLGALGAFATGIGVTEMAAVFATGQLWLRIPENMRISFEGRPRRFTTAKDIILHVIGKLGADSAVYKAVEFSGPTVKRMTIAERMTMCNMSVEMGAKTGIIAPDGKNALHSDPQASYQNSHEFDISSLEPQVACPPSIDNIMSVEKISKKHIKLNQVFIGSCTNGRFEDLKVVAQILKGEKVHRNVRLIISPASFRIYRKVNDMGLINTFIDAQAMIVNPGCSACFGGHTGILAPGETCLSTGNRNYTGRMGDKGSTVYISSPAVAAASALYGEITDPSDT